MKEEHSISQNCFPLIAVNTTVTGT